MIANYHTHTFRCRHALGDEREYVENAVKNGIKTLGFADHVPYPATDELKNFGRMRMKCSEAFGYVESLLKLKEEFKEKIDIKIGFEAEYFPKYFQELCRFLKQFPVDFLIIGQHFVDDEINGKYIGAAFEDESLLKRYVDVCIEGMNTGMYTYLAHPDVAHYTANRELFLCEMKRLFTEAKRLNMPVEFNLLGFSENRHYPKKDVFEVAAEVGNDVILGCDAHKPIDCGRKDIIDEAVAFLEQMGLTPIETVTLVKPDFGGYAE